MTDTHEYDDIIDLHRPAPRGNRTTMSMHDRAAQFAPFAALGDNPGDTPNDEEDSQLSTKPINP